MNSIQLREKRAALVNEMNHIVAAAQTEGRSLNAEENQKFDAIENDVRSLGESAEKIERAEQMKKEIAAGREARAEQKEITKHEAFSKYLRHGLGRFLKRS
jgi:HK97 family phage major capsid protein